MNPKSYNRLTHCPRCEEMSFEHLETHSHCASCLYSPEAEEPAAKPKSLNTGKSFLKRLEECDFSLKNFALLAVVASLAACASVNKGSESQNDEEAAKREQRLEMRHFRVDRHNF